MKIFTILRWGFTGFAIVLVWFQFHSEQQNKAIAAEHTVSNQYELVWSDEFESEGLPNTSKWSYDVGDGCPDICGWGNN